MSAVPFKFRELDRLLDRARAAAGVCARLAPARRAALLRRAAAELEARAGAILAANARDLAAARRAGLPAAMLDRLALTPPRVAAMAAGVRVVAGLRDPVGRVAATWRRPNGLRISRVSVPIGVILIIYESRPNVTAECAALCVKSGNAVVLRGGREALESNRAIAGAFARALAGAGAGGAVALVATPDRRAVDWLLAQEGRIQLVIPRGGEGLIRRVARRSRIPVIKHYKGICHVYLDRRADAAKAEAIVLNAKLQRPGVCNAMETLLVHERAAPRLLPRLGERLRAGGCELRADARARRWLPAARPARPDDFGREFLAPVLAVKVVGGLEEAVAHIARYGSGHTDAIVTEDRAAARRFLAEVDSSSVMWNASTRFADGFEYGFGAEIGISTDKIHARGPMGLEGLTSYKYVVEGDGQVRK